MEKEFEALENLLSFAFVMSENMVGLTKGNYDEKEFVKKTDEYLRNYIKNFECRDILKQALNELQAIKESNSSEALDRLLQDVFNSCDSDEVLTDYETIKQALLKAQEMEKELNILKDSPFILQKIFENKGLKNQEQFDKRYFFGTITEDKYQTIKEWLESDKTK